MRTKSLCYALSRAAIVFVFSFSAALSPAPLAWADQAPASEDPTASQPPAIPIVETSETSTGTADSSATSEEKDAWSFEGKVLDSPDEEEETYIIQGGPPRVERTRIRDGAEPLSFRTNDGRTVSVFRNKGYLYLNLIDANRGDILNLVEN